MDNFDCSELEEFQSELLKRFEKIYPEESQKFMRKQTNYLGRKYKAALPKKTGNLKKGAGKNTKKFKGHYIGMIYNTAPHAHLVEDGHFNTDGSFTPGKHTLYMTMTSESSHIDNEIEKFIDKMTDF